MNNFGLIISDTSRSRAYLSEISKNRLFPDIVIILDEESTVNHLPGKLLENFSENIIDKQWPEANFDPTESLFHWIKELDLNFVVAGSRDINDSKVINILASCDVNMFVYSGYGGAILQNKILSIGKMFLHIHGGYLPEYKGSTTNYYSILRSGYIGASAILLTKEIDSGPIIKRIKTIAPIRKDMIDHIYDSAIRSRLLVMVLRDWINKKEFNFELPNNLGGDVYYIIHPVLKHIAILGKYE